MKFRSLCLVVLLACALPAFAADEEATAPVVEAELSTEAVEVDAAEVAPIEAAARCAAQRDELFAEFVVPTPQAALPGCFPVWQPGSCSQSCQLCYCNSDCPEFFGMFQKCMAYCP